MSYSTGIESAFGDEIVRRFRERLQSHEFIFQAVDSHPIWFDATCGTIVMECPNFFLVKAIESLRFEIDAIARSLGCQMQIVVTRNEKLYW